MADLVADFVLRRLREWGVHRIYGYPGDGINGFLGALDRAEGDPELVQTRHEETAAFMACGHAKFTEEVGVCLATSGPGAIHLLNGLYDAKLDHAPVVAMVGQQKRVCARRRVPAGGRPQSLFKDVAHEYVQTCMEPAQTRHLVDRALRIALDRRASTAIISRTTSRRRRRSSRRRVRTGRCYSSVGYSRRASCRRTPTSAERLRSQCGRKGRDARGPGCAARGGRGGRSRRHARRRRGESAARPERRCRTTCRS